MSNMKNKIKKLALLEAFLAVFFWSVYFPLAKNSLSKISVESFALLRFFFGFITLVVFIKFSKKYSFKKSLNKIKNNRNLAIIILFAGFIGIFLHQFIQVSGINKTSASNTAWILAFIPAITFILSLIFLKEKSTYIEIIGLIIAFLGVVYLTTDFKFDLSRYSNNDKIIGDLLVFGSCITWSIYTIINKKILKYLKPIEALPHIFFVGLVFLIILNILKSNNFIKELLSLDIKSFVVVLLTGVFPAGIGYIFWYDAISKIGASRTTFFVYLEPFLTMITAAFISNEIIELNSIISGIIIIVGLLIMEFDNYLAKKVKISKSLNNI